jgi:uncharacterized membrane protein
MSAWFFNWVTKLRSSLWLIPSCMAIAAIFLSLGVPYLDEIFFPEAIPSFPWLSDLGPEGAMTLLSTIAGSMITIAGVVFSITIVALTLASAQFGPRLLGNFMRDRGNQVVLGTFVATFLYCLLVLGTIRVNSPGAYTPYWGALVGLVLAICSLGVLIYFIHHIAISIQAPNLIAVVYGELEHAMARLFPEPIGQEKPDEGNRQDVSRVVTRIQQEGIPIPAETGGYLQAVESEKLMKIAREHNLVFLLHYRPGHFLVKGLPLGKILVEEPMEQSLAQDINRQFICGSQRTQEQDIEFVVLQLVEVAVRALSPGINDPFTCIQCIDHLTAILCQLAQRHFPSPYRFDEQGTLRIIAPPVTFTGIINAAFYQIRQHGAGNVAVTIRLLEGLGRIGECVTREEDRQAIRTHVAMLQRGSLKSLQEMNDLGNIENRCRQVYAILRR